MMRLHRAAITGCWLACVSALCSSGCTMLDTWDETAIWPATSSKSTNSKNPALPSQLAVFVQPNMRDGRLGLNVMVMGQDRDGRMMALDGPISFYAYDDAASPEATPSPDHIWEFSAAQLDALRQQSKLGPSHSIWLPMQKTATTGGIELYTRWTSPDGTRLLDRQRIGLTPPEARYERAVTPVRLPDPPRSGLGELRRPDIDPTKAGSPKSEVLVGESRSS